MAVLLDPSEVLLELGLSSSATEEERAIVNQQITKVVGAIRRHLRYDPLYQQHTAYHPQFNYSQAGGAGVWEVTDTAAVYRQLSESATNELYLQHVPVRSISALYIDYDGRSGTKSGAFAAETQKVEGTDFWANYDGIDGSGNKICRDGILRSWGMWPTEAGAVKVVYYAGYTSDELRGQGGPVDATPIWETALEEVCKRAKRILMTMKSATVGWAAAGGFSSENLGDYSYSRDGALAAQALGLNDKGDLSVQSVLRLQDFVNYGWGIAP